jgi:formylglycine-generating enzyme required for sulfatase activity
MATTLVAGFLLALIPVLPGCGDDGQPDAGDIGDADDVDVESDGLEDSPGEDSVPSEGDDGLPGTDADGDTYPEGIDCDDHDATIIPGSARPCTSACGTGTERCEAGAWVGCTAPTDCSCSPPGSARVIDCGNCGIASQRCGDDGTWEMPGECMDEGECAVATVETEACGICGTRSRICDAECTWRDWEECEEHGECARGTVEIVRTGCPEGQIQQRRCDDSCTWVTDVTCTNDCIVEPRTGGYQEEICIPGGLFVMGTDSTSWEYRDRRPVHEVTLSPYLIDKYPVTNERYRACVSAGACAEPRNSDATYFSPDRATYNSYPVTYVNWADAVTSCAWDGRQLPTEAQWEKAARGPAPREVRYPWGDDPDYCSYANSSRCGTGSLVAVDAYPLNVSYYGARSMQANANEWTRDWYDEAYYSVSPSFDPPGAATGTLRAERGCNYTNALDSDGTYRPVSNRNGGDPANARNARGFRCVREPWSE